VGGRVFARAPKILRARPEFWARAWARCWFWAGELVLGGRAVGARAQKFLRE